ncbi:MAG TPA: helical backbone metal receptor [Thermoanaerobaculia bacterium]|nr:helical backbone metal receptor [Thermoanaerobaculia bacterium]
MRTRAASRSAAAVVLLLAAGCSRPAAPVTSVQRIITLAPNLTQIVCAVGAGDRIVATDDFSDDPPAVKKLPKVGGMEPNVEKIVTLHPGLVLATSSRNDARLARSLAAVHIPFVVVPTDRLEDIPRAMERVGDLLHVDGRPAADKLRRDVAAQKRVRPRKPRVLFAVWADPLYVAGRNTFGDDLFVLTGAENAVQITGWPQYSLESLTASPPDVVLYAEGPVTRAQIEKLMRRHVAIAGVDDNLFTRPGPRVAEAAAALNRILDRTLQ